MPDAHPQTNTKSKTAKPQTVKTRTGITLPEKLTGRLDDIGHQVRTSLTDIMGMARLLQETALNEEQADYADTITRSSHELLLLVDNCLDLERLENGTLGVSEEQFGITEALLSMIERIRPTAAAAAMPISLEFAPDIDHHICCDKARLSQMVYNLAAYLIANSQKGVLRMAASLSEDEWGDHLTLVLSAGKPLETKTDSEKQGNIALEMSKKLARLMGGDITIEQQEKQNICATVHIRVSTTAQEEENAEPERKVRLLVAEDSRANQRLIGLILSKLGYDYDMVANGAEAVDAINTSHFDMILMDLHMPVMDGFAATRAIRALDDGRARTPIIALTADVRPQARTEVLSAGMDAYLIKPIDVPKLAQTVEDMMLRNRTGGTHVPVQRASA